MKVNFILLLMLMSYFANPVLSQGCLPGNTTLITQGQVDSFNINYPSCDTILGSLVVEGSDITNLDSLIGISVIEGGLIIKNCMVPSLKGLDSLRRIDQILRIENNNILKKLHALEALSFTKNIYIDHNDSLGSVVGLENVDESTLEFLHISGTNMYLCDIPNFCSYVSNGGSSSISGMVNTSCHDMSFACAGICFPGGATFIDQEQVDNFTLFQNGCKVIPGFVYIGNGISNLDSLIGIEEIQFLTIDNTLLNSLSGLDSLHTTTDLTIQNNSSLTNFDNLQKMDSVGQLKIINNLNLENFSGLQNVQHWGAIINIQNNVSLQSMQGLNQLKKADQLSISNNNSLENLHGFDSLHTVENELFISNNVNLASLNGLSNLDSLGKFWVSNNASLTDLGGMASLKKIKHQLTIQLNDALTSISGLEGLSTLDTSVTIFNNNNLSDCDATWLCAFVDTDGHILVSGNGQDCENIDDVRSYCKDCLVGGITFSSQSQIDSFPILYPDCGFIDGDVTITGADITNLDSLISVFGINGYLWVMDNPSLTSFEGLSNLETINGTLNILRNNSLDLLPELPKLAYVQTVQIAQMNSLQNMPHCPSLTLIDGALTIASNPNLMSFSGLDSIQSINGSLFILFNPRIKNLNGFSNLGVTNGFLNVSNLDSLASMDGVENLFFIGSIGRFVLNNNPMLENMDGLNLTQVSLLSIEINNNPMLTSLHGLESIVSVNFLLKIQNNGALTDCRSLCYLLENGSVATVQISGNPMSCGSQVEILDHCMDTCIFVLDTTSENSLIDLLGCLTVFDTISFDSCVFGDTIFITAPLMIDIPHFNLVADPSWDITIDASAVPHTFIIAPGTTALLEGITIISGSAMDGGAIENFGELVLSDVVIVENSE